MSNHGPKRRKRRKILLDMLGEKCAWCGSTDQPQFDHIDKSTKSFGLSGKGLDKSWELILEEVKKCQILCDSCHRQKTWDEDHLK